MKDTHIAWTDATFNHIWGCFKVSPGCKNCYAESLVQRFNSGTTKYWGPSQTTSRRFFDEKHWNEPRAWNEKARKIGIRRKVFCASMADVFEDHPAVVSERAKLWSLIEETPWLDWQLLTKRPENIAEMVPARWMAQGFPSHVWIGTSVESQEYANARIPYLIGLPDAVRFLSCEPLLGPLDLSPWLHTGLLDWIIIGGESGPAARKMDIAWASSIIEQCRKANRPVFMKQMGTVWARSVHAGARKGENPQEWPVDTVWPQEFPLSPALGSLALA